MENIHYVNFINLFFSLSWSKCSLVEFSNLELVSSTLTEIFLAKDGKFNPLFEIGEHEEFGFLNSETRNRLEELFNRVDELQLRQGFLIVDQQIPGNWVLVVNSKHDELASVFAEMQVSSGMFLRQPDAIKSNDPDLKATKPPADDSHVFHFAVEGTWVVLASTESAVELFVSRIDGSKPIEKNIADSRKFQLLRKVSTANRMTDSSLFVHVDPKVLRELNLVSEDWFQLLMLDEFLAVGAAFGITNKPIDQSIQLSVNGLLVLAQPRVGLAKAIKPGGSMKSLPLPAHDLTAAMLGNLDMDYFWTNIESLYNEVHGNDSFFEYVGGTTNNQPNRIKSSQGLMESRRASGPLLGKIWFSNLAGERGQAKIVQTLNAEIHRDAVLKSIEAVVATTPGMVQEKVDLNGNFALFAGHQSVRNRSGWLWCEGWCIQGAESDLKNFASDPLGSAIENTQFRDRLAVITQTFNHDREIFAAFYATPIFWHRWINNELLELAISQRDSTSDPKVFSRVVQKIIKEFSATKSVEPKSRRDCRVLFYLKLSQILSEEFGNQMFIVSDSDSGLRFSFLTFKESEKAKE